VTEERPAAAAAEPAPVATATEAKPAPAPGPPEPVHAVVDGDRRRELRQNAVKVVGLTLLLASALEVLLILTALVAGQAQGDPTRYLVDWLQKLPWALIVCVGAWIGLELGQGRPLVLGLAALVAAPAASLAARVTAQGLQAAVFGAGAVAQSTYAPAPPAGPSPMAIAGLRAVEYLCLALAVGWLSQRANPRAYHHAAAGVVVGALFGSALLALTASAEGGALMTAVALPAWTVNELLFPAGCALILFSVRKRPPQAEPAPA
jgi:hypothetical protein